MAVENFKGTWIFEKSEGLDEFLKALGVNVVKRKLVGSVSPTLTMESEDGCDLKITQSTMIKTMVSRVEFGKERTDKNPLDGGEIQVTDTLEDDGTWKTVASNGVTATRAIEDGKLVMTQTCGGVTCRRYFVKAK